MVQAVSRNLCHRFAKESLSSEVIAVTVVAKINMIYYNDIFPLFALLCTGYDFRRHKKDSLKMWFCHDQLDG